MTILWFIQVKFDKRDFQVFKKLLIYFSFKRNDKQDKLLDKNEMLI